MLSPKSVAVNAEEKWVHFSDTSPEHVTPELTPREMVVSPPATSDNAADSLAPGTLGPPGPPGPPGTPGPLRNAPSPLNLEEVKKKIAEQTFIKDDYLETISSPKDFGLGQRATPPPPPPPTYRTVVSSPGPGSGSGTGTTSGMSYGFEYASCDQEWPWLLQCEQHPPPAGQLALELQPSLLWSGCPVAPWHVLVHQTFAVIVQICGFVFCPALPALRGVPCLSPYH